MNDTAVPVRLSVVLPVYNEEACIEGVIRELHGRLSGMGGSFEILAVNDGSTDRTPAVLIDLARGLPGLRVLTLAPNAGQSAAMGAGFRHARGDRVVAMDADGQNDPADIPALVAALDGCDVCCGYRMNRQDTWSKRYGSRVANAVRRTFLKDGIRDTGCSLKAFKAWVVRDLPLELKGLHRFLPALALMKGAVLSELPVHHRARAAGLSKYTNLGRLSRTVADLFAVSWMRSRYKRYEVKIECG
ncbi:MAG: glycosyltransferase family 2 protein [Kiritimatiellia bacterium]